MSQKETSLSKGFLPQDVPSIWATLSLGFQQLLTMFPATVLVAILTKFDVGTTLLTSGLGTIIALLVSKRKIPMYYGSSFSYIAVIQTAMLLYANDCYSSTASYCPDGVRIVQLGIIGTAIVEILLGLVIMKFGKKVVDKVLPPIITGSIAIVIGISLAYSAIKDSAGWTSGGSVDIASTHWLVAFVTLIATVLFSVYLNNKKLIGMLPILLGAATGYVFACILGMVSFQNVLTAEWLRLPNVTLPDFANPNALSIMFSIAFIAIATVPESTAHLYQMSLYIDTLAEEMGRPKSSIKNLIGLNLIADGADDLVAGFLGGAPGTNYGENNSLMAITRNYSVTVLMTAAGMAILMSFVGKISALVGTIPQAVTGGLSLYLFGVIGMQGVALIKSENVDLFSPAQMALGAIILVLGIGGSIGLPSGLFPFKIPVIFPTGIPAIVFSAIVGILFNIIFIIFPKKSEKAAVES